MTTTTQKLQVATDAPDYSNRYRVEPTGMGFWGHAVKCGTGTRDLFVGHKKACATVAAELLTAFTDGQYAERMRLAAPSTEQPAISGVTITEDRPGLGVVIGAEQPAAPSVDGPVDMSLHLMAARGSYTEIARYGAQQREAGGKEVFESTKFVNLHLLTQNVELAKERDAGVEALLLAHTIAMQNHEKIHALTVERDALLHDRTAHAGYTCDKISELYEAAADEYGSMKIAAQAAIADVVRLRAQLARPFDLAGLTRYDLGESGACFAPNDGSYILFDDVQALLSGGAAPVSGQEVEGIEAYVAEDGVEHSHLQYGRGVFFTYNCMKTLYAAPQPAAKADAP